MRGVEHTGEWEAEDEGIGEFVGRYRDANGIAWAVESLLSMWSAQAIGEQIPPASVRVGMSPTINDYPSAERRLVAGSKDELRGKIDAVADRVWNESLRKTKGSGGAGLALLALFAFGSKRRRRAR